jgi:hypothetical protein
MSSHTTWYTYQALVRLRAGTNSVSFFKRHYLDPTFDTAKELMENNLLWQKRPKTSKATLRPTIMTLCRTHTSDTRKTFL